LGFFGFSTTVEADRDETEDRAELAVSDRGREVLGLRAGPGLKKSVNFVDLTAFAFGAIVGTVEKA
jgi:hypothetical protein